MMPIEKVLLELSRDEAIVLFDWLSRFNRSANESFSDQAEQRVLWDLEAALESHLAEPFAENYDEVLAAARSRVRDSQE